MKQYANKTTRAGFTMVEILVTGTLFTVIMLSSMALMERDAHLSESTLSLAALEDRSGQMLHRIDRMQRGRGLGRVRGVGVRPGSAPDDGDELIAQPVAAVGRPIGLDGGENQFPHPFLAGVHERRHDDPG